MVDLDKDYEIRCQQVWLQVYIAVASCDSTLSEDVPAVWADRAVKDFRERFKSDVDYDKKFDRW